MKAIVVAHTGGPEVLELRDVEPPVPKADEALVRVHASGVNFIDTYLRTGHYPVPQHPFTPGFEGAGVVERVGEDVTSVKAGDRVAWASTLGSYAEYVAVPGGELVQLPPQVSFRDGAAAMLQGMTAHYLTHSTFALGPGHVALAHAGAGGVGLLLTQFAKMRGATVITTVSSDEKAALSKKAGADHVIRYDRENFAEAVRALTGGAGAHVVYDGIGKTTFERSLDALRPRGYMVLFGAASGPVPPLDPQVLNAKGSLFLTRPKLGHYTATPEELAWRAGDVFDAIARGSLSLRAEHVYPLAEAARAHEEIEGRVTTGKLVLEP